MVSLLLITLIIISSSLVLSSIKLFSNYFDIFENTDESNYIFENCSNLSNSECIDNINCRMFNLGGNRNSYTTCRQSGAAMGAFGNSRIIRT